MKDLVKQFAKAMIWLDNLKNDPCNGVQKMMLFEILQIHRLYGMTSCKKVIKYEKHASRGYIAGR